MNHRKKFIAAIAFTLGTSLNSFAQYTGPQAKTNLTTVKNVLENASSLDKSDALVKLEGYVVERIKEDEFWFKDSSGKIIVEIERKHFPSFEFNEKTKVVIVGEVDHDLLEGTEIEVESISLKN